ncbi:MAG: hypothetical protein JO332_16960, partial [Planctomycetaceae bacterium]|nr:hypothetical protein [Planctomycetaceae bacterium]
AAGAFVAALLYGLLCAAERRLPESTDPWLDAFIADGMKAEFRSISTEPQNHVLASDLRPKFEGPAFAGTQIRNYLIQNTSVQVVALPASGLVADLADGRKLDQRFRPQGPPVHYCRSGRWIAFVSPFGKWVPIVGQLKTPRKDVEQIFDAFEATAKRLP